FSYVVTPPGGFFLWQAQRAHQAPDHHRFVLRVIDEFYRLDHGSKVALHNIRRTIDKAPPRHDAQTLKGDSEVEKVGQNAESLPLQLRAKRIAEIGPIDNPACCKCLGHHRLIADDPKLNVPSVRLESPGTKAQHPEHPPPAADTLPADPFALEIRRRANIGRD